MPEENQFNQTLSEEYREHPALKDFTDVNQLAKAFTDTKRMVGGMIRIPGEDASQDDVAAFRAKLLDAQTGVLPAPDFENTEELRSFYQKLGMPEDATGYTPVEGMAEARFGALAKLAHEAGISDRQFQQVAKAMVQQDNDAATAFTEERGQAIATLKTEWGEAYDQKVARAQRLAEATKAPTGLIEAIGNGNVDAATLRWLDAVAASIGGEGSELRDLDTTVTENTKEELEAQRDELTRRLQSDERMPASERERLIAKNVDLNSRILALAS